MVDLLLILALLAASPVGAVAPGQQGWEKLHEVQAHGAWLSSVWADGQTWFAAGKDILVRGGGAGVVSESRPGRTVLGLSATRRGLLALGANELILRFDGKQWIEEHFAALPAGAGKRATYGAVLHSARAMGAGGDAPLIAYGPHAVLVSRPDGAWVPPPEPERDRLSRQAQLFAPRKPPARCPPNLWLWLSGDRGWLSCHGGRSFMIDGAQARATGVLPRACAEGADAIAERGPELYLLCEGRLWRSNEGQWLSVVAPQDLRSIAGTPDCLYAASDRAVWKNCPAPPSAPPRRARRAPPRL